MLYILMRPNEAQYSVRLSFTLSNTEILKSNAVKTFTKMDYFKMQNIRTQVLSKCTRNNLWEILKEQSIDAHYDMHKFINKIFFKAYTVLQMIMQCWW